MSGFRVNGQQNQKSGSVTFEPLWIPNFIPKIRKILGAVFAGSRNERTNGRTDERTNGRTDKTDFIDPSVFNRGPINKNGQQIKTKIVRW